MPMVDDPVSLEAVVRELADGPGQLSEQEDVFFECSHGRLKLRVHADDRGELIAYTRPDVAEAKTSTYSIAATTEPAKLREVLEHSLGERAVVRKQRWLYMVGRTRIHLDQVERLGSFLELEVVLQDGEGVVVGEAEAGELMERLGIASSQLIEVAYVDLLDRLD